MTITAPSLVAHAEYSFACLYAYRNPPIAIECARLAREAAFLAGLTSIAAGATALIIALGGAL